VLNPVEEALDEVALAVKREIARTLGLAVSLWRNDRGDLALLKGIDETIGIIGLVPKQRLRISIFKQPIRADQVVGLARREHEIDGITQGIDESMNFGG